MYSRENMSFSRVERAPSTYLSIKLGKYENTISRGEMREAYAWTAQVHPI